MRFLSDGKQPWFSFWGTNKIATVDPKTFQVTEFVLPDPKTRIRRMGVTSDDMIWYGDWSNGKLSRFNPKTGEVNEWDGPSGPQSQPYGMTVIDDMIWYVEFEHAAEQPGALRSEDREVPDLRDSRAAAASCAT